jgi:hypothetical protein
LLLHNFVIIAAALLQSKINTRRWTLKNDAKVQFLFHDWKNIISRKKAQKAQMKIFVPFVPFVAILYVACRAPPVRGQD